MRTSLRRCLLVTCIVTLLLTTGWAKDPQKNNKQENPNHEQYMSHMGQVAKNVRKNLEKRGIHTKKIRLHGANSLDNGVDDAVKPDVLGYCDDGADEACEDDGGYEEGPAGGQAETSIAVDSTGQHIVVGVNDTRGFSLSTVSVSGYLYSDDGGLTLVDGGQLPTSGVTPGIVPPATIAGVNYPQVFGDPDIKYLGGCNFIYASIMVKAFNVALGKTVQTMSIHRSTDCGHTWVGPFEVTASSNPNGLLTASGGPQDAADKEFIDVDPDTGRVLMSWSNFTPSTIQISTTFSDNIFSNPPTWSARKAVAQSTSVQSSVPRFAGQGSPNAYLVWRRTPSADTEVFARSTDNGATWSANAVLPTIAAQTITAGAGFFDLDLILGNDRISHAPSMAVDTTAGPFSGYIYVVYSDNDNKDGADIAFQRSTNQGVSFTPRVKLNARLRLTPSTPGDRSQWEPWVTVDKNTGRVYVFYYDQGIATSGDLTETSFTYSNDGGVTWSKPVPLTARPFHAGWGNDTGQPNLGDYNQAVAQNGELFAVYALTAPVGFTDGLPSTSFTTPDTVVTRTNAPLTAALNLGQVTLTESGGNGIVDAGDTVKLKIALQNYVTNSLNASTVTGISGTISTATPGVTVARATSAYADLASGASGFNTLEYVLQLSPTFVAGTPIELSLAVSTASQGPRKLLYTQQTGTPVSTTIFSENFDSLGNGAVLANCTSGAGWCNLHAGGATNTVPWTTSNSFCGTSSPAAFHQNKDDGSATDATRFERLLSPVFAVPANAEYVTLDMDICYDTEENTAFNIFAWDGFTLRIGDVTNANTFPASVTRSVLAEAFETEMTTGNLQHYPKALPRNSNANYFQDMSVWGGDSQGTKHVHMRLPGMAGRQAQLRFEFTQDVGGTCTDNRPLHTVCGVMVDNIVVNSVVSGSFDLKILKLTPVVGQPGVFKGVVSSEAPATGSGLVVNLSSSQSAQTTMPASVTIAAGQTDSPSFTVTVNPTYHGVISITGTPVVPVGSAPGGSKSASITVQ